MALRQTHNTSSSRASLDSLSSVSTTSIVFERLHNEAEKGMRNTTTTTDPSARVKHETSHDGDTTQDSVMEDSESGPLMGSSGSASHDGPPLLKSMDRGLRRCLIVGGGILVVGWLVALALFVAKASYRHARDAAADADAVTGTGGLAKKITLDQVLSGFWAPESRSIVWIADPDGNDGLLLEQGVPGKDYLVVQDVRRWDTDPDQAIAGAVQSRTLMRDGFFRFNDSSYTPDWIKPSPSLDKVLIGVARQQNWRHSFTASYFILDVASGRAEPLVPNNASARVQLATWSPLSTSIAFTMDNNLFLRHLNDSARPVQITSDGGPEYFYGIPDWVYEEEVFGNPAATWWSADGSHLAFLRTNETGVNDYPIQYYLSRPSATKPPPGQEAYPETRLIKYPKSGSHNPVVDLQYYNIASRQTFSVALDNDFADSDRIINNVLWAGHSVLVKETNRVGDHLRVHLVDVDARSAKTINDVDMARLDGGWYEISHKMTFVPADASRGRLDDGYVDTIVHNGFNHLAYFAPLDSPEPVMLTSGDWEVEDGALAVDAANQLVYFVATKRSSITRHLYSVRLDGSGLAALTDDSQDAYYSASFSEHAGYALVSYSGPGIPTQKVVSTPSSPAADPYERTIEDNAQLAQRARDHQLPALVYGQLDIGNGTLLNYMERRPPHFDPNHPYPVLFQQYSGPESQTVSRRFHVDFHSYLAASLGYLVVTVDPRGTGFRGRAHRVPVRRQLGLVEASDHIAAARLLSQRPYVDPDRIAIWGWSYGGFQTLKTLELDAGRTFSYGMAVAPVTDWRFYDSIYSERYMDTPQANPDGYAASRISNASALAMSERFLVMHGLADDNVHLQNTAALLDALDLADVSNYDVHVFPDSDHSISFHNANAIVYQKLRTWLINAFNGEWLKIADPKPIDKLPKRDPSPYAPDTPQSIVV
ncbi:hypothetical protein CDD82_3462 [Ophiocordyceps australis]|uniref:Probable dipeptidyl-aminopeptidase B n=1 Tax=Ophiocordyceps australis TaxID=1399860 RepID=A0A2C5ZC22_9HYPO|nr:hypothetical protein CDD82_3462 [Ophiocordyceps australis]